MKVDGACHCGAIAYEAEVDPAKARICHCSDCQVLGGAPFRTNIPALPASFRLLRGEPATYIKTAESGSKRAHTFCPTCGSALWATTPGNTQAYTLRMGALRQRAELTPSEQIWCRSAMPWLPTLPGTAHDKQP